LAADRFDVEASSHELTYTLIAPMSAGATLGRRRLLLLRCFLLEPLFLLHLLAEALEQPISMPGHQSREYDRGEISGHHQQGDISMIHISHRQASLTRPPGVNILF